MPSIKLLGTGARRKPSNFTFPSQGWVTRRWIIVGGIALAVLGGGVYVWGRMHARGYS